MKFLADMYILTLLCPHLWILIIFLFFIFLFIKYEL